MTQNARDRSLHEVLQAVLNTPGVTRSELATSLGMSRSAVTHAVARLVSSGRLIETDAVVPGERGRGRPASVLTAAAREGFVAGLDFGHQHVSVALATTTGDLVDQRRTQLEVDVDAAAAIEQAATMLGDLMLLHKVPSVLAAAAGIPGPLDSHTGLIRSPTILSGWVGMAPSEALTQRLGVDVAARNDAFMGAFGELRRGAGQAHANFLYVKVSSGIGATLVIDRKPYSGASGLAGEIGHIELAGRAELCRCGKQGCLEAVVSIESVARRFAHTHPGVPLVEVLESGDVVSSRVLDDAGRTVGGSLAPVIDLVNPSALLFGGELGQHQAFIDGATSVIQRKAQPAMSETLVVNRARLGQDAELVGATELAVDTARRWRMRTLQL